MPILLRILALSLLLLSSAATVVALPRPDDYTIAVSAPDEDWFSIRYDLHPTSPFTVGMISIKLKNDSLPSLPPVSVSFAEDGVWAQDSLRLEASFSEDRTWAAIGVRQYLPPKEGVDAYELDVAWVDLYNEESQRWRTESYPYPVSNTPGSTDCPPDCEGDWSPPPPPHP